RKKEAESLRQRMCNVLRQQLELVPEDVRARILLSSSLAYDQDADESIRHLQTAVALRPGDSNILYNAACTYGVLGKKAEALETIKRAFAVGYGNWIWRHHVRRDSQWRKAVSRRAGRNHRGRAARGQNWWQGHF